MLTDTEVNGRMQLYRRRLQRQALVIEKNSIDIHCKFTKQHSLDETGFNEELKHLNGEVISVIQGYIEHFSQYKTFLTHKDKREILWNIIYVHLKLTNRYRQDRGMEQENITFWKDLEFLVKFKLNPMIDANQPYFVSDDEVGDILEYICNTLEKIFLLDEKCDDIKRVLCGIAGTLYDIVDPKRQEECLKKGLKIIDDLINLLDNLSEFNDIKIRAQILFKIQNLGELYTKINIDLTKKIDILRKVRNLISDTEQDLDNNNILNFIKNLHEPSNGEVFRFADLKSDLEKIKSIFSGQCTNISEIQLVWFDKFNSFAIQGKLRIPKMVWHYASASPQYIELMDKIIDDVECFAGTINGSRSQFQDQDFINFILDFEDKLDLKGERAVFNFPVPATISMAYFHSELQKIKSHSLFDELDRVRHDLKVNSIIRKKLDIVLGVRNRYEREITAAIERDVGNLPPEGGLAIKRNPPDTTLYDYTRYITSSPRLSREEEILTMLISFNESAIKVFHDTIDLTGNDLSWWKKICSWNSMLLATDKEDFIDLVKIFSSRLARICTKILDPVNRCIESSQSPLEVESLKVARSLLKESLSFRNYSMHGLPLYEVLPNNLDYVVAIRIAAMSVKIQTMACQSLGPSIGSRPTPMRA